MPITISQVLDLLMGLVLIMFVPIGLWRGALREWLTFAGITLGGLLAASWGSAWGESLSRAVGLDPNLAAFTVAAAFFLGATLTIGYGGGVTLPYRPDLSGANRALGALIGLGNGILILSGLLQLMQRHLFSGRDDSPLKASGLAIFLIDSIGWIHLALFLIFLGCVFTGLLRRAMDGVPLMDEYGPRYGSSARAERPEEDIWHPSVPPAKPTKPAPQPASVEQAHEQTAILQVVPQVDNASAAQRATDAAAQSEPSPAAPPVSAAPKQANLRAVERTATTAPVVDIARRQGPRAVPPPLPANVTPIAPPNGRAATEQEASGKPATPGSPEGASATESPTVIPLPRSISSAPTLVPRPAPPQRAGTGAAATNGAAEQICPSCGTAATARSRFCLVCGHIIGEPEKRQFARHP